MEEVDTSEEGLFNMIRPLRCFFALLWLAFAILLVTFREGEASVETFCVFGNLRFFARVLAMRVDERR